MDTLKDLFTTTSGWALIAISGGALLYLGTLRKIVGGDVFAIRQEYDFRNNDEIINRANPNNDPWKRGINSIALTNRNGRFALKSQLIN